MIAKTKKSKSHGASKLASSIQEDLNLWLRTKINNPKLTFVSFTRIEVAPDNSLIKVYWDTFQQDQVESIGVAMDGIKGKLRSMLAQKLQMRSVPHLAILHDLQYVREFEMTQLLKEEQIRLDKNNNSDDEAE
jgi:ribosome-binding factor A